MKRNDILERVESVIEETDIDFLVGALEIEFGIKIPDEDLGELVSPRKMAHYIEKKLEEKGDD